MLQPQCPPVYASIQGRPLSTLRASRGAGGPRRGARHAAETLKPETLQAGRSARCAQVAALADRGGARDTRLVLDGAHTPAAAAALAGTLRRAFPHAALALVVGMAADKDAAGVMAALRRAAPVAVAFTQAPIAGGLARCV